MDSRLRGNDDETGTRGFAQTRCHSREGGNPSFSSGRLSDSSAAAKTFFDASGAEPWTTTPEELAKFQAAETAKWGRVIKAAGIEPE